MKDNIDIPAGKPEKQNGKNLIPKLHFKRLGRELAMQFLFQCDLGGMDDLAENLENFWEQAEFSGEFPSEKIFRKARTYAEKIIAGVCEQEEEINAIIARFSDKWDISRMPIVDRNIIRVAIYEMHYCPDIPLLVSIDEAIEIAKDYSSLKSGNFINGLLNAIKDTLPRNIKDPAADRNSSETEGE